jgi:hypothetical protein
LYILENLQIQLDPGATFKTCPSSTNPLSAGQRDIEQHFSRKKKETAKKKRRIWLNGGRERMELKKLKKQGWSTSYYSGEVPEEMRWKTGI